MSFERWLVKTAVGRVELRPRLPDRHELKAGAGNGRCPPRELRQRRGSRLVEEDEGSLGSDAFDDLWLVFHQPDGSWLGPDAVSEVFLRRVRRFGLPRLTSKGLRHTPATLALEQGIHPRVVRERLGHSTIAVYSHVTPTLNDEAAAELIGRLE
jgi:integrase